MTAFLVPTGSVRNQSAFAVFICTVTGLPRPPIQWTRQGGDITEVISPLKRKYEIINETVSDAVNTGPVTIRSTLVILNLTLTDSRVYTCTGRNVFNVTNYLGAVDSRYSDLSVQCKCYVVWTKITTTDLLFLPLLTVPPKVRAVISRNSFALWGQRFTISFSETNAIPPIDTANLKWQFFGSTNGSTLISDANPRYNFSSSRQNLTITNIQLSDAGRYSLIARNPAGISMDFINLTVYGKQFLPCLFANSVYIYIYILIFFLQWNQHYEISVIPS